MIHWARNMSLRNHFELHLNFCIQFCDATVWKNSEKTKIKNIHSKMTLFPFFFHHKHTFYYQIAHFNGNKIYTKYSTYTFQSSQNINIILHVNACTHIKSSEDRWGENLNGTWAYFEIFFKNPGFFLIGANFKRTIFVQKDTSKTHKRITWL